MHEGVAKASGNACIAIERNNGAQRWRWMAEPFGTSVPEERINGAPMLTLPLRFPGQYADAESGMAYNGMRSYISGVGRYSQSDPIGLAGGINTYGYVGGNPLLYADPKGLKKFILLNPTDPGYSAAIDYPDDEGKCIVIAHGSFSSVNGMRAPELNKSIDDNACDILPVKLNSCCAGYGDNSIASQLARIINVPVFGADTPTWTDWGDEPNYPLVSNLNSLGYQIPNIFRLGRWIKFKGTK